MERLVPGCAELSDAFNQRQAGPDRTLGIIFVGLRIAEVDKDAVALEFGDVAAKSADHVAMTLKAGDVAEVKVEFAAGGFSLDQGNWWIEPNGHFCATRVLPAAILSAVNCQS